MTPWPYPRDSALDRARSIARSCLEALREQAPEIADTYQRVAHEFGETWLTPAQELQAPDGLVTAEELAQRMGVRVTSVRDWCSRGVGPGCRRGEGRKLTRYPGGLLDPVEASELLAWARAQRPDAPGRSA